MPGVMKSSQFHARRAPSALAIPPSRVAIPDDTDLEPVEHLPDRIAELEHLLLLAQEENRRHRLMFGSMTDHAIIVMDSDGRITEWNAGAAHLLGYVAAEMVGRSGGQLLTAEDRGSGVFVAELEAAIRHCREARECWHVRRDGSRFWGSGMTMAMVGPSGAADGFMTILRDHTDLRARLDRSDLLLGEMNHRINNIFVVVQAVAVQSGRRATDVPAFLDSFGARLRILARAQDMLMRSGWSEAELREVIAAVVSGIDGEADRIDMAGPCVTLAGDMIVPVSLAMHELTTNAVKYGALSVPQGRIAVDWAIHAADGARQVVIGWRERGGPPVRPPERRGFGSQLLQRGLPAGSKVELHFNAEGFECRLDLPFADRNGSIAAAHQQSSDGQEQREESR